MAPAISPASQATREEEAWSSPEYTRRESSEVFTRVASTASRRRASTSTSWFFSLVSFVSLVRESRLAERLALSLRVTMSPSPQSERMCVSSRLGAAGEPKTVAAGTPEATSSSAAPSLIAAAAPLGVPLVNMRRLSTETPAAPAAPAAASSSSMRSLTSSALAPWPANPPMRARITGTSSKRCSFLRFFFQMPSLSSSQKMPPRKDMK